MNDCDPLGVGYGPWLNDCGPLGVGYGPWLKDCGPLGVGYGWFPVGKDGPDVQPGIGDG